MRSTRKQGFSGSRPAGKFRGTSLSSGFIASWQMSELTGSIVYDAVGGHHGSLKAGNGASHVPSPFGGAGSALQCARVTNGGVFIPYQPLFDCLGGVTVSARFQVGATTNQFQAIFAKSYDTTIGDAPYQEISIYIKNDAHLEWRINAQDFASGATVATGDLIHAIGVCDGVNIKLWIMKNGVLPTAPDTTQANTILPTNTNSVDLGIGQAQGTTGGEATDSIIEQVELWNRGISDDEAIYLLRFPYGMPQATKKFFLTSPATLTPLSWLPRFPDIAPRAARVAQAMDASAPVLPPTAAVVTPLSWGPEYHDGATRVSGRAPVGESTSITALSALPTPVLSFQGSYPDRIDQPRRPVNEGQAISEPGLPAFPVPSLSFKGTYPDQLPPARRNPEGGQVGITALANFPLPSPTSWGSVFPDGSVRPPAKPVQEGGQIGIMGLPNFPIPPLSWGGFFPDGTPRAPGRVAESAFAAPVLPPSAAVPLESWLGSFWDGTPRAPARPVAEGARSEILALSNFAIPSLSWLGVFPDGAARAPLRPVAEGGPSGLVSLAAFPVPALSWLSIFPDGAARRAGRAAEAHIAQQISQVGASLTPLAWLASYPDFAGRAKPSPVLEGGPQGIVSLAAFPVPPLSWASVFPDGAARAPGRVAHSFAAWVPGLANLAIPALSWGPQFVDPTWRPKLLQVQDFGGPVLPPGAPPAAPALSWGPSFPDVIFRTALREGTWAAAPLIQPLPPALSWGPRYPDLLLRAQAAREGWKVDPLVQPFPPGLSFLPTFPGPTYPPKLREATWSSAPVAPVAADSPLLAWAPFIPEPVRAGRVAHSFAASPVAPPAIFVSMWDPHYPSILRPTPIHPMQYANQRLDPPPALTPADRMGWQPNYPVFIWPPANPMRFAVGGGVVVFLVAPTGELHAILLEVGELHASLTE